MFSRTTLSRRVALGCLRSSARSRRRTSPPRSPRQFDRSRTTLRMSRASNASRSSRVESLKRFELGLAAVAFCVCGGLAVLFLLFGEREGALWKILTTAVVIGLYSLLALPGARLLDQGRSSILAWSAVLLAALGLLWAFRIVLSGLDDADGSWRLLVTDRLLDRGVPGLRDHRTQASD